MDERVVDAADGGEDDPRPPAGPLLRRRRLLAGTVGLLVALVAVTLTRDPPPAGVLDLGPARALARQAVEAPVVPDPAHPHVAVIAWDPGLPGAREHFARIAPTLDDATGLAVLDLRDPHLGHLDAWCPTSRNFESDAHGERFDAYGFWLGGPSPRGYDLVRAYVDERGHLIAVLAETVPGPPRAPRVLPDDLAAPAGPSCTRR
ncbi:MAG: hypothetical protein ACLGIR_04680 [Actinomycetes bacterium]